MSPKKEIYNWIIEPAGSSLLYLGEEVKHASVLRRSLSSLIGMKHLLVIAKDVLQKSGKSVDGFDFLISESIWLEKEGNELYKDNCSTIHQHSLVSMWVSVEVAVEDTLSLALKNDPNSFEKIRSGGLNVNKKYSWPLGDDECHRLCSSIQSQARAGRTVGESFVFALSIFEIPLELSLQELSLLAELNAVRNCILHRQGVVDSKSAEECAALGEIVGRKLTFSAEKYLEYYDAASRFVIELLKGATRSPYFMVQDK